MFVINVPRPHFQYDFFTVPPVIDEADALNLYQALPVVWTRTAQGWQRQGVIL